MSAPAPTATRRGHTPLEDIAAIVSGACVMGLGMHLLHAAEAVTGGVVGASFLVTYATGWSLGLVYFLINAPFYAFALWRMGGWFTLKTIATVALISVFNGLHAHFLPIDAIAPLYAILLGSLLAAVGMIMVFRHRSSAGGFGIVAAYAQERYGLRAGWVQGALDVVVVGLAFLVTDPAVVALSIVGVVLLSAVIAMNHRPGRYLP